jgi:cobalt-zinc-cadmium resistance protein CzcA
LFTVIDRFPVRRIVTDAFKAAWAVGISFIIQFSSLFMLHRIIGFSVRNKLIIGLFTLVLIAVGVYQATKLPIDALPDITSNQVQVITVSPSLAAPEVESLVTFPIEQATANIPGLKEIRSISRFGLSVVTIVFGDGSDVYWARQQVSERLIQVRDLIPASAGRPELAPATTGLGEVYQYVVRPQKGYEGKYDLTELRSIQDWIVRRQLLGTPGVADVSSFGGYLKQYEIAVIPEKLKSMNVSISDIFRALQDNNQNSGGAYIEKGAGALFIRTEGIASSVEDIRKIYVSQTVAGIPVYINDVAEVRIGHAVRYGAMTYRDQGEVAGAVVLMLKGANGSEVVNAVKEKIKLIEKTLPEGVTIESFLERTKMVNNAIGTVKKNLLEGALIVIFVLVFFLGNFRAGLIVASVIPLSMLFAVSMMNLFGVTGNLMSLGALDFGLIVDGAVIIVEAVMSRLSHGRSFEKITRISQEKMDEEVSWSAGKMMSPAIFGQIIILIVYLPILSLVGIEGKMFRPMAQTVSFALIGAFLLSLTYVPMMSALCLSKKLDHRENWSNKMMNVLNRWYQSLLAGALKIPKTVVLISFLLFGVSAFVLSTLGGEFIPELEEGDFAVDARVLTGSSLTTSIKTMQQASSILQERFPEVEKIVSRVGASEIPTDPMPIEMSDIIISLKPRDQWVSAKTFDELANKMSKALEDIPGLKAGFQFPVQMRFNELISGARQDVVCKIFGENLDTLAAYADRLGAIIRSVKGAKDIYIETATGLPQIVIQYKREAMALYRLNIADVNRIIRTAFAGESAGIIYENERRYDLVVRLKDDLRKDISNVQDLLIATPMGSQIPLSQVANVELKSGPNQIQRENTRRRIITGFNVRDRDVESIVDELSSKVNRQLKLPAGYSVTYGGQFENMVEAEKRLSIAVPVSLLLIFIMLYFAFGSVKYGLMIFTAIPLSAIGGIFALWIRDMPFSISAGIGFIALFGVAVLNGIVLITEFNQIKKRGMINTHQIITEGTQIRLRPVLMTASVASLGFLPMALSQGSGAEVQRPLATVVIGGLISATILTLLVLPVLYQWVEHRGLRKTKHATITTVVILLLFCGSLHAQTGSGKTMSLEEMLTTAVNNNISIQASRKNTEVWKALQERVFSLPKTQIGAEYGNINSAHNDTRFFVNQSFSLPVVYRRQKDLYVANQALAVSIAGMKEKEIRKEVKMGFYELAGLLERQKLLLRLDSIYSRFLYSAELRLKTGETNILEKSTAESQMQQMKLQQEELLSDIIIVQQRLQLLLNTSDSLLPAYDELKMQVNIIEDSSVSPAHPEIAQKQQQIVVKKAETDLERNALTPDIAVGYNNLSIIGYQSIDGVTQKYYDAGHRFNIYQLTLGLPIFTGAVRSRIKAGEIEQETAKLELVAVKQSLDSRLQQLKQQQARQLRLIGYYERTGLQQAELIIKNARLGFEKGDMGYVEWTLLMNNAVNIQVSYLEALNTYNSICIETEYLTGK